jgi:hypothetical protein
MTESDPGPLPDPPDLSDVPPGDDIEIPVDGSGGVVEGNDTYDSPEYDDADGVSDAGSTG